MNKNKSFNILSPNTILNPMDLLEIEEPEIWHSQKPKYADHIRVSRGLYNHHGIYVSEEEVIHFTGQDNDDIFGTQNEVIKTNLKKFLKNGLLEVKIYNSDELADLYHPIEIVQYARAHIGDCGYNVVFNNCEHFANMCTLGQFRSKQIENLIIPKGGNMLGKIGEMFGGLFGGNKTRETITTIYEPDKV